MRCFELLPKELALLIESYINNKERSVQGKRYSDEVKATALMLHFISPAAYRHFSANIMEMPCERTLERFTENWPSSPGNMDFFLKAMQLKYLQVSEFSRYCVICVDEMSLKCHLSYDRKEGEVVGLTDNGLEKTDKVARNAFVILVRGLCENWKLPIEYTFVNPSCSPREAERLIFDVVRGLRNIGFHPIALVSDMGPNFQGLTSLLGVNPNNTSFSVDGQPLHFFYDTPHLIKSIRNNFSKYDILFDGNKRASFRDIIRLYELEKDNEFKLAPKLTEAHVHPNNWQKMSVQLATQVLSHSVASAVYLLVGGKQLSSTAVHTADFVNRMDKLFDIFNSSKPSEPKEMRRPFSGTEKQLEFLSSSRNFIEGIKFVDAKDKDVTNSVKCVKGCLINLGSLEKLWSFLKDVGFHKVLTRRLNQDPIEHFFSAIRMAGGCSRHPTPREFTYSFKKVWGLKYLNLCKKASRGNCEPEDEDEDEECCDSIHRLNYSSTPRTLPDISWISKETPKSCCPTDIPVDYKTLDYAEENAIVYVAGYLFKKCLEWHTCSTSFSEEELCTDNVFIELKQYENARLVVPPSRFVD